MLLFRISSLKLAEGFQYFTSSNCKKMTEKWEFQNKTIKIAKTDFTDFE